MKSLFLYSALELQVTVLDILTKDRKVIAISGDCLLDFKTIVSNMTEPL